MPAKAVVVLSKWGLEVVLLGGGFCLARTRDRRKLC